MGKPEPGEENPEPGPQTKVDGDAATHDPVSRRRDTSGITAITHALLASSV